MLEWKGCVRRKQRDLVMFVLCFWVIASHISTCNANMPAGQMRFLALSLQGCQGETQGTQQQHKWNQPTLPPPPPSNPIPNLDLCLGFQLWSECVRLCVFVQTALKIRHALFSYVCHWEWICGYFLHHFWLLWLCLLWLLCEIAFLPLSVDSLLYATVCWVCCRCLFVCVYDVGVLAYTTTAQKCIYTQ